MTKLTFTVHSAARGPVRVPATVGGVDVQAYTADGLVVELVHGCMVHTLQLADAIDEAEALFVIGADIEVTYAAPAPPED